MSPPGAGGGHRGGLRLAGLPTLRSLAGSPTCRLKCAAHRHVAAGRFAPSPQPSPARGEGEGAQTGDLLDTINREHGLHIGAPKNHSPLPVPSFHRGGGPGRLGTREGDACVAPTVSATSACYGRPISPSAQRFHARGEGKGTAGQRAQRCASGEHPSHSWTGTRGSSLTFQRRDLPTILHHPRS